MSINPERSAIIISASSDIGAALAGKWLTEGWRIFGSYRTRSAIVDGLEASGARLVPCDVADAASVSQACANLRRLCPTWDVLVQGAGDLQPVGSFLDTNFADWERSIRINFTGQIQITRELLQNRRTGSITIPSVLFFAGGGTNSAPVNYSAYTISKIALIKMCELLDAEIKDTKFTIIGPGWVKTKIHRATLDAGRTAGLAYDQTVRRLRENHFTSMEDVLNCCQWVIDANRDVVGGRNFSVVQDAWRTEGLVDRLKHEADLHKLRRRQ